MSRFHTIAAIGLIVAGACANVANADMWLANFGGASPTVARRFRESDGGFIGLLDYGPEVTTGMRLGPDGKIYVAVNGSNQGRIARFDAMTGQPLGELVGFGQSGYESPGNFTFGTDGNVYAISTAFTPAGKTGILKFDAATSAFAGVFIAPAPGASFGDVELMPDGSGDLLVSDQQKVERYDGATGAFIATFIAPGAGGIGEIAFPTFGPDGNLYVVDFTHRDVRRYDGNSGAFIDIFIPSTSFLPAIREMAFGNDGNLYVSQRSANMSQVRRYDGVSGALIDTFIASDPVYNDPTTIVFTPEPAMIAPLATMFGIARRRRRG